LFELIFFCRKGDYYRYLTEFLTADAKKKAADNSHDAYKAASDTANSDLPPTNPIRLGLALNFSVFYYEILESPDQAFALAKKAFDDGVANMDSDCDGGGSTTEFILRLIRDNIDLWMDEKKES
jgi:14-3-3 protein epsilon